MKDYIKRDYIYIYMYIYFLRGIIYFLQSVEKRKRNWIGHVVRGEGLKKIMEGRMRGKRGRGRPREGVISELKGDSYGKMKRMAEDREVWRSYEPWTCNKLAGELMMMI